MEGSSRLHERQSNSDTKIRILPNITALVIHSYLLLRHHVQLFQRVRVLRVGDVSDMMCTDSQGEARSRCGTSRRLCSMSAVKHSWRCLKMDSATSASASSNKDMRHVMSELMQFIKHANLLKKGKDIKDFSSIKLLHCIFVLVQVWQVQPVRFALALMNDRVGVNQLHRHGQTSGKVA